jgi:hypothetical protein
VFATRNGGQAGPLSLTIEVIAVLASEIAVEVGMHGGPPRE